MVLTQLIIIVETREYCSPYYAKNRGKLLAKAKIRYKENIDGTKTRSKKYAEDHSKKIKAYQKIYQAEYRAKKKAERQVLLEKAEAIKVQKEFLRKIREKK